MINKRKIISFLILVLVSNCSFDNKTGIWGDSEKEKKNIADLERKQKQIIEVEKIFSSENVFSKEISLTKNITLSKARKNAEWTTSNLNNQNFLGNIYLMDIQNKSLKKKIGKNKFSMHKNISTILAHTNNLIFSDDKGTIYNINKYGKINWKKNIYKKSYKRIYKHLTFSISKNNIYIADNIGLVYSINLFTGKLLWIKNYGLPLKSNIKIFNNKIFLIDQDNKIISLDTKDGSLIWDILSISSFIKTQNLLSLAISKEGYLFASTSSADLLKIDSNTGNIIWSRNTAGSLYANATDFFTSSDIVISESQIFFSSGTSFFSYNIDDGAIKWQNEISFSGPAIIDKQYVFIVSNNGYFVILNKDTGEIISSFNILKILKRKKQNTQVTSFIMGSGKIYSTTSNGFLIVSSTQTGKAEYFKKIGEKNVSPLIINDGTLYILTENSKIIGLR